MSQNKSYKFVTFIPKRTQGNFIALNHNSLNISKEAGMMLSNSKLYSISYDVKNKAIKLVISSHGYKIFRPVNQPNKASLSAGGLLKIMPRGRYYHVGKNVFKQ